MINGTQFKMTRLNACGRIVDQYNLYWTNEFVYYFVKMLTIRWDCRNETTFNRN